MNAKTKMENELSFVKGNGMFPTVEVNLDSLEKAGKNFYLDEICEALKSKRTVKKPITVYLRESVSINFGEYCNSLFIGVAGLSTCVRPSLLTAFEVAVAGHRAALARG